MKKYLMAVDAGTGSVRAVLFDTRGNQVSVSQREWEHREDPRYPGSMDFDWENGWALAAGCIREALKKGAAAPDEVAAVSTTSMREGIVLYDGEGRELWACANVDARADDEAGELKALSPSLEREVYAPSGQTYALGALPRILWVKKHLPGLYARVAAVSMFNDWLIARLTGQIISEPSNGCTTGIFDLSRRAWLPQIAEKCGLRGDIFPPVLESGTVAGAVSARAGAQTGLAAGTPVVTGGGDAQLGCIGVGVVEPGQAAVFGGSFWQYEFNTGTPKTDAGCRVRVNCHAVPGVWQYEALAFYPGLVMRWYRDAFCQQEKEAAARGGGDAYALMDEKARQVPPGCGGMLCTFSDVMNFIAWRHAAPSFVNFSLDAGQYNRVTFYRAIMENAALVTRGNMELVRQVTGASPSGIVFAGGASKSPLWCQILADVMGLPVRVPVVREATALGAAMLAGVGAGVFATLGDAAGLVRFETEYAPIAANRQVYDGLYERWQAAYKPALELSDRGVTRHMWAAPGL